MRFVNLKLMTGLRKVESVLPVTWELNIHVLFETQLRLNTDGLCLMFLLIGVMHI
jgi:hypothetical protein